MPHPTPMAVEADLVSRTHLVRLLMEQMERTFSTEGSRKALHELGNLLRRLDESTLRALVQWQGAADEDEMREAGEEDAAGGKP
ncbi:MAG TPA: hypothetical protein VMN37_12875 [Gemmatimonadales bacterium]|nr:hypothetical protein [Gemmatimonadales bacterium]